MKSKVMELIKKCKNANSFFSAQEVETQIRAAIKEFDEMMDLEDLVESSDGNGEFPVEPAYGDVLKRKQALAAFGVDEK